jgi:hypothetical protein
MYTLAYTGLTMLPYIIGGTILLAGSMLNLARRRGK